MRKHKKSTYIRSECTYSVFEHPYSVSKQKPRDYPPCKCPHIATTIWLTDDRMEGYMDEHILTVPRN